MPSNTTPKTPSVTPTWIDRGTGSGELRTCDNDAILFTRAHPHYGSPPVQYTQPVPQQNAGQAAAYQHQQQQQQPPPLMRPATVDETSTPVNQSVAKKTARYHRNKKYIVKKSG
jgi:hypothetical protein